ncbi:hypothetical protein Btru_046649 [Bulinus truncatus]|nr:hypothetical protein Btru_046649 [Bulinus truncatus]
MEKRKEKGGKLNHLVSLVGLNGEVNLNLLFQRWSRVRGGWGGGSERGNNELGKSVLARAVSKVGVLMAAAVVGLIYKLIPINGIKRNTPLLKEGIGPFNSSAT